MPRVLVRQAVDLYGVRYHVGLRDIPAGHACGANWDYAVNAGYVDVQDKPLPLPESVLAAETVDPEPVVYADSLEAPAEVESVEVKPKRKRG